MARETNTYHGRLKSMPKSKGWAPTATKKSREIKDPNGVLAAFYAKKRAEKEAEEKEAADLLERKRELYRETGEVITAASPAELAKTTKESGKGKGRRQSKPGTLWVMSAEGEIQVKEYESTKEATEAAEVHAESPQVRWARAFNDTTGKVVIGRGWVFTPKPGEKVNNMPLKFWVQLTASERHKVKETELGKYQKPGWVCKDMSQKNPRWQSVKNSRRGETYDRRNRAQGIKYSETR